MDREMLLLAQLPGTEEALESAARRGWEAVLLVVLILATFACFGWVIRKLMAESSDREQRLAARVTHLEEMIRTELMAALRQNSEVMGKVLSAADSIVRAADNMSRTLERFTSILDVRPCLLPSVEQRKLMKEFGDVQDDGK
jgi:hypothetical protein